MVYKSSSIAPGGSSSGTGGGTVSNITSTGGTITVGSPTGPTTNVDVANNTANTLAGYNNSGVFSDVTIGTNLTLSGGVLNATGGGSGGGAVSSVFGRTGAISANYSDYAFNLISGVAGVSQGGTGVQTLSAHGVLLGEGAANISAATTGISGRLLIDQGNADPSFQVISGDSTLANNGVMINTAVHGVAYGTNPATNTVPVVTSSNTITYEQVPNAALANSAITIGAQTGLAGGGPVTLGSAITLSMGTGVANTLGGYNSSGVFSDVSIGSNLSLSGGILNGTVGPAPVNSVFGRTGAVVANWNDYNFNLVGGTAAVSQGGTGQTSLTIHSVLLGEGAVTGVGFATTGIAARILIDQGASDPSFKVISGDISAISTGALTLQAIQGTTITGTSGTSNVILSNAPTLTNPIVGTQSTTDNSTKAASTAYVTTAVNNAIAGVNPAVAVQFATTLASDTSAYTYNNGASGIGATLTGSNNIAFTADGQTATALLQRVLIKNDTQSPSGAFNGVYYVSQLQTAILPPILTRALDYDQPSDINNTGAIPVINGTLNAQTTWVETATVNTVGTDPLSFTKFSLNPTTIITNSTAAGGSLAGTYPNPTIAIGAISGGTSISISNSGSVTGIIYTGSATGVSTITNTDGSLTISPQTGVVQASLNTAHANTWTATQTGAVSGGAASFISQGALEFAIFVNGNSGTGTPTLKWENGNLQSVTISGACTLGFTLPTHPARLTVIATQSASQGFAYAYAGTVLWPGGTKPTLSSISNAKDISSFVTDGTTVYGIANTGFA